MIISMFDVICVTNRKLCCEDFLIRIEKLACARPKAIMLREKDLPFKEYLSLAAKVTDICNAHDVPCILHSFFDVAAAMNAPFLHLPMDALQKLSDSERKMFPVLGASCHSSEEAIRAQSLGCRYITAGHIFDTGCKSGLPGRGTDFLAAICRSVSIPVYAIGGITPKNAAYVRKAGAAGICIMSSAMTCRDPSELLASLQSQPNKHITGEDK